VDVPANDWAKREALRRLIRQNAVGNAIVFCNRKRDVDVVAKSLKKHGFNAAPLHGDLDQSIRTRTLDGFRSGAVQILVASDVAARGLDIPSVSHIFNFDVPYHADDYVHRIGRTGRAGRSGHAYMLVTPRDGKYMDAIERLIGSPLKRIMLDGLAEAVKAQPARDSHHGDRNRGRRGRSSRGHEHHHREHSQKPAQHGASQPQPHAAEPHRKAEHKPQHQHAPTQHRQHVSHAQKTHAPTPADRTADAHQLPAFLLRPVPLPKTDKPAPAARKKVPVTA
jgi:superfamily II DNA/RNA helicase